MERGKLIVIEGTDCSGKETQSNLLIENLKKQGYKCVMFGFPNYDSPTGKIIGGPFLGKEEIAECYFEEGPTKVDPKVSCLYYTADFKYNIKEVNDYLDKGYYVILDRYVTSSLGHQGSKITDKDERFQMYQWIDKLNYWLMGLPKPDITIFLHVPFAYAKELKKNRGSLDKAEKDEEHLKNAERAYLELVGLYNWKYINCIKDDELRSIPDINQEIMNIILSS